MSVLSIAIDPARFAPDAKLLAQIWNAAALAALEANATCVAAQNPATGATEMRCPPGVVYRQVTPVELATPTASLVDRLVLAATGVRAGERFRVRVAGASADRCNTTTGEQTSIAQAGTTRVNPDLGNHVEGLRARRRRMTVRAFGARCLGTGLAAVMMLGVTGEAQRGSPPAPEPVTPTIQAEEIASIRAQFAPGADGPAERPNHPPLDQIPPRRMPDEAAAAARRAAAGPLRMVGRDLVTGRTIVGPERTASALANTQSQGGGYAGADGRAGVSDIDQQATMSGSMSVISTASRATPPWRMNVKVVIRDGASYSVCSGTMRDAETVLTAGHCVFDFGGTGWADEIWVYPGWDGVGPHFAPPASITESLRVGQRDCAVGGHRLDQQRRSERRPRADRRHPRRRHAHRVVRLAMGR